MIEDVIRASCDGKHRFDDAAMAHKVADRMRKSAGQRRKRRRRRPRIQVYRCRWCHSWHVGSVVPDRAKEVH